MSDLIGVARRLALLTVVAAALGCLCASSALGAGTLTVAPDQVDFGSHQFGVMESRTVVVTNAGPDHVVLSDVVMIGDVDPFEFTGGSCDLGVGLSSGETCDLELTFSPIGFDPASYEVALVVAGGEDDEPAVAQLTATTSSLNPLMAWPETVAFSLTTAGTTGYHQWVGIRNLTSATLPLDFPTVTGPFWISGWNCGSQVGPGGTCGVTVHMAPPAGMPAGVHGGRLTVRSGNHSVGVDLTGQVVSAPSRQSPTPRVPTTPKWPVKARLAALAGAVPATIRGGPSGERLLPAFKAGAPGRLTVAILGRSRGRQVRIGGGKVEFYDAERGRLPLSLDERGIALLRRPRQTRIEVVAKFDPRVGATSRQRADLVVKAPKIKRR